MKRLLIFLSLILFPLILEAQIINARNTYVSTVTVLLNTSPFTKTFSTWNNTVPGENLADKGDTGSITYSRDATDGAAKFVCASNYSGSETGREAATTTTWQDWGVPTGATVTKIELKTWKKKLVTLTSATSITYEIYIVDSGTASITNSSLLTTATDAKSTDADYVQANGSGQRTLTAGKGDSGDVVRLTLKCTVVAAVGMDIRFDDFAIEITFTGP